MKLRSFLTAVLLFTGVCAYSASATPITAFIGQTITTTDQKQLGRPSRSSQPQTWTGAESYPGILSTTAATTFYYKTYTLDYATIVPNNYIELSFTDTNVSGLLFISAYGDSYDPNNRSANWLGDLGFNSAAYGGDSLTFQVGLQYEENLVLVVNTTGGGASGTNNPFDIYVSGYTDSMYDDTAVTGVITPEPSTLIELGTGMLAMAGVFRRRFRTAV